MAIKKYHYITYCPTNLRQPVCVLVKFIIVVNWYFYGIIFISENGAPICNILVVGNTTDRLTYIGSFCDRCSRTNWSVDCAVVYGLSRRSYSCIYLSKYQLRAHSLNIQQYKLHYTPQHVSSSTLLIIRRTNCITTASGIVTLCKQPYIIQMESGLQSALHPHTVRLLTEGDDTRGCGDTIGPCYRQFRFKP